MALEVVYRRLLKSKNSILQQTVSKVEALSSRYIPVDGTCPTPENLATLIEVREKLRTPILQLQKQIVPIENFIDKVPAVLNSISAAITVLKLLPIPNTLTTAGLVLTLGDSLNSLKNTIKTYADEVDTGKEVIQIVNSGLLDILKELEALDSIIERCSQESIDDDTFRNFINSLQTTTLDNPPIQEYRGYKLELVEEAQESITRRYIRVKDVNGSIIFNTPKTFASDIKLLMKEAKFQVDKLLQ